MRRPFAILVLLLSGAIPAPAPAATLEAATGYKLQYEMVPAQATERGASIIFMHGKDSSPEFPGMRKFADFLAGAGFPVYLPRMPWSKRWDGTAGDAAAALDALIVIAAEGGRRVVVGGQSMGAAFAIAWRPADAPPSVVGRLLTSPGHMLDLIPPQAAFWKTMAPIVEQAKARETHGLGKEKTRLGATNVYGTQMVEESYDITPEIFLSFHDPERFPSVRASLMNNRLPVFWAVGTKDPIQNARRPAFDLMPANQASRYLELDADHNSAIFMARAEIVAWLKSLAGQ
jgi:pimeloyl-ACP methyl ester carboxylesterase